MTSSMAFRMCVQRGNLYVRHAAAGEPFQKLARGLGKCVVFAPYQHHVHLQPQFQRAEIQRPSSLKDLPEGKMPGACIGCGACAGHCSQSIDIPEYMKRRA